VINASDCGAKGEAACSILPAPAYDSLPLARSARYRSGPTTCEVIVHLEIVTPVLGGSFQPRTLDQVDVVRVPTVRGHLRFWWRALYAVQYQSANELYERESELWGRAATDDGGRSSVEVRIDVEPASEIDDNDIDLQGTPGAYALWPARGETRQGQGTKPPAPRRQPGTRFSLTLLVSADHVAEVRNALRAWILFGGYGGRTRRGLGSLKVLLDESNGWLPTAATRTAFTSLFGVDIFAVPTKTPGDVPWLGGAALHFGKADRNAQTAWTTALEWLREFRQGTNGQQGARAREPGTGKAQPRRPSISNWPEADKIRRIKGKTNDHAPRHNGTVAWPRAGFGLPIIGQFQRNGRNGGQYDEPSPFELRWRAPKKDNPREFDEHDRLASPLIVKALPLADGTFAPCALWLNRGYPMHSEVGLARTKHGGRPNEKEVDPGTVAPFDRLVASGDPAHFSALGNKGSLRQAFLDWLRTKPQVTVVAP
jgi:CRISPR-associated protein Cmr1